MNRPPMANSHNSGNDSENSGLAPIDDERSHDRADDGLPAADRAEDHHLDRRHDADERRRHEADLQREHRAADRGHGGGEAEHEDLEIGDVVAGKADPFLLVAGRDQDAAELARGHEAREEHGAEQQEAAEEVEDVFRAVGANVPSQQGAQIGDAVDAAGIALPSDDQDGHHRRQRLGDDGEVDAADPALEHRGTENEGRDASAPR